MVPFATARLLPPALVAIMLAVAPGAPAAHAQAAAESPKIEAPSAPAQTEAPSAPAQAPAAPAQTEAPAASAPADGLSDYVAKLGSDSFEEKDAAVRGLATLADPRAIPVLKALAGGELYVTAEGKIVVTEQEGDNLKLFDAVSHAPLGQVSGDANAPGRIVINNRLRGLVDAALSGLMLFSHERDDRLAAARDLQKHPSREAMAVLGKALASETDPEVKSAMTRSLTEAELSNGTTEERIAAIKTLAGSSDPEIHGLLAEIRDSSSATPELKAAAEASLSGMEDRERLIQMAASLFEGISLGSVLLLAAIGLAITFGVMGVINMAHGEMIMIGAYSAYVVQEAFRGFLPPFLMPAYLIAAVPIGFLVAGGIGVAIERSIIRLLYGRPLETLLATWGLSLILQQLVRSIFGAPNKAVANPDWMTGGFEVVGGFAITWNRLYIIVFCLLVLGALALVLRYTTFGLHMRAVTQNRTMAAAMGIRVARVDALTFGLGSGIAGMAGVALSQIGNVSPNLGTIYIVDSFLVVVFGGVGNLAGTLVGAMTLGIVNKFLEPFAGAVLGKIFVLVAIILFIQKRPRGLFALKGRAAEV